MELSEFRRKEKAAESPGKSKTSDNDLTFDSNHELQHRIGNNSVLRLWKSAVDEQRVGELRSRVSRITGTDLSGVQIGQGNTCGKRAITHDAGIKIGQGATEHDLAHELAHAAQQLTDGEVHGAGVLERRADQIADAALSGSESRIASGSAPMAAVLGAGDPYSREALTIPAPPAGFTVKDFQDQLQLKIKNGDITGYSISGIKADDPDAKYLYNALILLADKRRWGSELDLVTSTGAADGLVTVRFDSSGKAEAQLVGKSAPSVPAASATVSDAITALKTKYKLADVKGELGKTWNIDELNKIIAAWARLSSAEAAVLEGYSLIRTDDTLQKGGEKIQGLTTHVDKVNASETKASHSREIRFADRAFADDSRSFIGDAGNAAPASFEVIIHEVGHALEAKTFDDLNAVAADDSASSNQRGITAHKSQLAANKAINDAFRAGKSGRFPKKDIDAGGQNLLTAVSDAQKKLQAFEVSPDASNESLAKKAMAERDAVKAKLSAANKVLVGFTSAIAAQDTYYADLLKFYAAKQTAAASRARADALKSGSNTKRLQAFVDFVNRENIPPPTAYAARHWPADPVEFFCEAFSLWKNDPAFFAKYSSKLKAWFDAGNHLK